LTKKKDLTWGGAETEDSIRGATVSEEGSSDFFLRPAKARLSLMPPATAALNPLVAGDDEDGRGGTGLDWLWPMERGIEDERGAKDC
jgi:hypothetical protein